MTENEEEGNHRNMRYNNIYGKNIYPVAFNPLDNKRKSYYKFNYQRNRYEMIR